MSSPSATCSQHALREAVGICVRCRAPMCAECITKIDGINHCRSCLEALSAETRRARPKAARRGLPAWLMLGLGACTLTLLTWFSIEVMMPGSGWP